MRIALINSGLGLMTAAAEVHRLRPDADLVLAMDPDGMPWGPRTPDDIAARSLACARAAAAYQPDVMIFACNTGSVHALGPLRAEFEPDIPVVGTVPAIKPAAAHSGTVAIWATAATTGSAYQHRLIADFAASANVTEVACPGLADAIHNGDTDSTSAIITASASRTPPGCGAVVLGCTEYEIAAELIAAAIPGAVLFGSAAAVAAQALRRAEARPTPADSIPAGSVPAGSNPSPSQAEQDRQDHLEEPGGRGNAHDQDDRPGQLDQPGRAGRASRPGQDPLWPRTGRLSVLLSGRPADFPAAALAYPAGRLLAALPRAPLAPPQRHHAASTP